MAMGRFDRSCFSDADQSDLLTDPIKLARDTSNVSGLLAGCEENQSNLMKNQSASTC
jgi:hypothetical protein